MGLPSATILCSELHQPMYFYYFIAVFKILLVAEQSSVWREIPLWQWQECLPPWGPERHLLLVLQSLFPSPSQPTPFLGRFSSSSGYIYSILMTGSS